MLKEDERPVVGATVEILRGTLSRMREPRSRPLFTDDEGRIVVPRFGLDRAFALVRAGGLSLGWGIWPPVIREGALGLKVKLEASIQRVNREPYFALLLFAATLLAIRGFLLVLSPFLASITWALCLAASTYRLCPFPADREPLAGRAWCSWDIGGSRES